MPENVYVLCHWTDKDGLEIIDVFATLELAQATELPDPDATWREGSWSGVWEADGGPTVFGGPSHGWTIARQRLVAP